MLLVCSGNQRRNADLSFISHAAWISSSLCPIPWVSRNLYEMKWGFAGLFLVGPSAMLTQAVLRSFSWQLQALSMNRGDHVLFSHSDVFFLPSHSSSPEKVSAGLAYLHPPFQVWKASVHLQSLSIIHLCIKLSWFRPS